LASSYFILGSYQINDPLGSHHVSQLSTGLSPQLPSSNLGPDSTYLVYGLHFIFFSPNNQTPNWMPISPTRLPFQILSNSSLIDQPTFHYRRFWSVLLRHKQRRKTNNKKTFRSLLSVHLQFCLQTIHFWTVHSFHKNVPKFIFLLYSLYRNLCLWRGNGSRQIRHQ